ncbi:MAG TPA: patatin-like phospholipase family protein [Hanamia sp.]|jgi:patatin-like phospholipase/acyl hydrolase|nr:patatin-like phospholipase family protein [Hanamia sp.]
MTKADHLSNKTSPKRILALDGGGIRGALTLGYLQRIEDILRKQHGDEKSFRLSQYFDLIGGTSTGSIIAACLAIGMSVNEIKTMYMNLGDKIFAKKYKWWKIFEIDDLIKASYNSKPLEQELQNVFGSDTTLASDRILTGLCIVAKRADTNSVWPLINHPDGKYYDSVDGRNKDILLWKAVRASAAAPTYFLPQIIDVGGGLSEAAFVDGGVSMANNPSLQLLMVATMNGFPFKWKWGEDNLMIVSVGTGMGRWKKIPADVKKNTLLNWASQLPDMLMQDASWQNQMLMQWLSNSPTAWEIDQEIGKLDTDSMGSSKKGKGLISYLRYNIWLDATTIGPLMNKQYSPKEIDGLVEMSNAASRFELYDIGAKAAAKEVSETHFPDTFKI